ncbi:MULTISPECIES: DUF421 domain-containing protein [Metabacillus]|uniref:YetF C-terminal domain-containing protein n=2 Tax=Metabacillus TaxID=2675233 RepID=A0A179TAP2_9BACI|nr:MULTISPECIES: DUF421 domain-containing protein [Metabacillus]OAS89503.1 hypothetical protein A6K24_02835 [Metabacillus litoralis]QNF29025.1 DUF421 domain-containing protein [Metabacillus sp. KUDC1714]
MELDWVWKAILIVIVGTLLLRVAGRKSISQMTLAQTVIMVGIGSLLIQPVAGKNLATTFGVGGILVVTLVIIEYLELKSDRFEKFITGQSKIVIENGILNEKNLSKLRLTVDQLEMKLRQQNVSKISDVQWATLEPNGQLGYALKQDAQPVTKKEFQQLQQSISSLISNNPQLSLLTEQLNQLNEQLNLPLKQENLFTEIKKNNHNIIPPKHLQ